MDKHQENIFGRSLLLWMKLLPMLDRVRLCMQTSIAHTETVPPFIGQDYFCDTGSTYRWQHQFCHADSLWDGSGCGSTSSCCSFNNPPWFCKQLPQPTSDDIEMRVCVNQENSNEDVVIETVELFVQYSHTVRHSNCQHTHAQQTCIYRAALILFFPVIKMDSALYYTIFCVNCHVIQFQHQENIFGHLLQSLMKLVLMLVSVHALKVILPTLEQSLHS